MSTIPNMKTWTCGQCGQSPDQYRLGSQSPCVCGAEDWRRGGWCQTFTGKMFFPFDPRIEEFDLDDIAVPLSRMCRFGGHCLGFYSVADHSVWVMEHMPKHLGPEAHLAALLHDAGEAYLMDVPRPIKYGPGMEEYRRAEDQIHALILIRFKVVDAHNRYATLIKEQDIRALATEKRDIMAEGPGKWQFTDGIEPHPDPIEPTISMQESYFRFIEHAHRLLNAIG